jgi:hypothetical protein
MGRIKIKDLPKDMKLSEKDLRKIRGGILYPISRSLIPGSSSLNIRTGTPSIRIGIDQGDWAPG